MLAATADMLMAEPASLDSERTPTNEALLVNAARQGDRAAFAQLHDAYARMVHGIVLARAPFNEAHDLVQDVFLEAMRKLHTLRDSNAFGPWIAAIARNFASGQYRRRRGVQALSNESAIAVPSAHEAGNEEAARILDIIRSLPESYGETLVLRLVEGLTGPQIAACTGLTPGSVRVNLHRGMQLLRQRLGLEEST